MVFEKSMRESILTCVNCILESAQTPTVDGSGSTAVSVAAHYALVEYICTGLAIFEKPLEVSRNVVNRYSKNLFSLLDEVKGEVKDDVLPMFGIERKPYPALKINAHEKVWKEMIKILEEHLWNIEPCEPLSVASIIVRCLESSYQRSLDLRFWPNVTWRDMVIIRDAENWDLLPDEAEYKFCHSYLERFYKHYKHGAAEEQVLEFDDSRAAAINEHTPNSSAVVPKLKNNDTSHSAAEALGAYEEAACTVECGSNYPLTPERQKAADKLFTAMSMFVKDPEKNGGVRMSDEEVLQLSLDIVTGKTIAKLAFEDAIVKQYEKKTGDNSIGDYRAELSDNYKEFNGQTEFDYTTFFMFLKDLLPYVGELFYKHDLNQGLSLSFIESYMWGNSHNYDKYYEEFEALLKEKLSNGAYEFLMEVKTRAK